MIKEQKKKCLEIINSWNGNMDADFHGMIMSIAAVLGKDKDITEENYKEIIDGIMLEIAEGYGYNEEELSQSKKEVKNMLDNEKIEIPKDDFDIEFKDYLSGLKKCFQKNKL